MSVFHSSVTTGTKKTTVTAAGKCAREVCKCKHAGLNKHQTTKAGSNILITNALAGLLIDAHMKG